MMDLNVKFSSNCFNVVDKIIAENHLILPEVLVKEEKEEEEESIALHQINSEDFTDSSTGSPLLPYTDNGTEQDYFKSGSRDEVLLRSKKIQLELCEFNDYQNAVITDQSCHVTLNKLGHDSATSVINFNAVPNSLSNDKSHCKDTFLFNNKLQCQNENNHTQGNNSEGNIAVEVSSFDTNAVEEVPCNLDPLNHADYHVIDENHPDTSTNVVVCSTLQDLACVKQRKNELRRQRYKFECDECHRRYSTALVLKSHKVRHLEHSELPYRCLVADCQFAAASKIEQQRHVWRHKRGLRQGERAKRGLYERRKYEDEEEEEEEEDEQNAVDVKTRQKWLKENGQCRLVKKKCFSGILSRDKNSDLTSNQAKVDLLSRKDRENNHNTCEDYSMLEIRELNINGEHKSNGTKDASHVPTPKVKRTKMPQVPSLMKRKKTSNKSVENNINNNNRPAVDKKKAKNKIYCGTETFVSNNHNKTVSKTSDGKPHSLDSLCDSSSVSGGEEDLEASGEYADESCGLTKKVTTRLQCGLCEYCSSSPECLRQHLLSAHRQEPRVAAVVACPVCATTFTTRTNLRAHLLSHADERQYACDECDRSFIMKNRLVAHKRVVHCPKTFSCRQCSKAFPTVHHLSRHERIHTGEKPYRCCFCEFACNTQGNLVKHVRTRHNRPQYTYKQHLQQLGSPRVDIPPSELQRLQRRGAAFASRVLAALPGPTLSLDQLRQQVHENAHRKKQLHESLKGSQRKRRSWKKAPVEPVPASAGAEAPRTAVSAAHAVVLQKHRQDDGVLLLARDDLAASSNIQIIAENLGNGLYCTYNVNDLLGGPAIVKKSSSDVGVEAHDATTNQYYMAGTAAGKMVVIPIAKSVHTIAVQEDKSCGSNFNGSNVVHITTQDVNNGNACDIGPRLLQDQAYEKDLNLQCLRENSSSSSSKDKVEDIITETIIDGGQKCQQNTSEYIMPCDTWSEQNQNIYHVIPFSREKLLEDKIAVNEESGDSDLANNMLPSPSRGTHYCEMDVSDGNTKLGTEDSGDVERINKLHIKDTSSLLPCNVTISKVSRQQLCAMRHLAVSDDDDSETETYLVNTKGDVRQLLSDVVGSINDGTQVTSVGLFSSDTGGDSAKQQQPHFLGNNFTIHVLADEEEDNSPQEPGNVGDADSQQEVSAAASRFIVGFSGEDRVALCDLLQQEPRCTDFGRMDTVQSMVLCGVSEHQGFGDIDGGSNISIGLGNGCSDRGDIPRDILPEQHGRVCGPSFVDDHSKSSSFGSTTVEDCDSCTSTVSASEQQNDEDADVLVFLIPDDPSQEKW